MTEHAHMPPTREEGAYFLRRLISLIGDDPTRGGLLETPGRVLAAWEEMFAGYHIDPADFVKTFEDGAPKASWIDEPDGYVHPPMVTILDIPISSTCEHHMVPFVGTAHIAYVPRGNVLGLSKFVRIVDAFARRLQVQERLTEQIADFLNDCDLKPYGVGVVIDCEHYCMALRGVKAPGIRTVTSAMRGVLFTKPPARAEFLSLIHSRAR